MRNDDYIMISGWMVNELKLKSNELFTYSIIYRFSRDGNSEFKETLSYLQDWTNSSKNTIRKALTSLVEKGVIIKTTVNMNGVTFNNYKADLSKIAPFLS